MFVIIIIHRKQQLIDDALKTFSIKQKDLKNRNKDKLNKKWIKGRYHQLAKIYHPDVDGGDEETFLELQAHYGIMLAIIDEMEDNNPKKRSEKDPLAIEGP